jgi:hypothetical protein
MRATDLSPCPLDRNGTKTNAKIAIEIFGFFMDNWLKINEGLIKQSEPQTKGAV